MMNIGHYFYKKYFERIDFNYLLDQKEGNNASIVNANKRLLNAPLHLIPENPLTNSRIRMKVTYPGLISGVGIVHTAKLKEEFKLGLHFDYTEGMPVLYGSSVKGTLKSAFKLNGYIGDLVEDINLENEEEGREPLPVIDWEALKANIFEGKDAPGNNLSIYHRDVFFDAVIVKAFIDQKGHPSILASDSITSHKGGSLKDPVPITFIKIAPGVQMEFRFKLTDFRIGTQVFTKEHKRILFQRILSDLGIGAKTNVGYGQLEEV